MTDDDQTARDLAALGADVPTWRAAQARAASEVQEAGADPASRVRQAFLLAFGRPPTPAEAQAAGRLAVEQDLAALCRALLNANEFFYY